LPNGKPSGEKAISAGTGSAAGQQSIRRIEEVRGETVRLEHAP
jgi:hypothetical protein